MTLLHLRRALLALAPALALASNPPAVAAAPSLQAARTSATIALDGRLEEPDWQRATPARGFLQIDPQAGEPATRDTEVRVLFDAAAVYLGVTCLDDAGPTGVRVRTCAATSTRSTTICSGSPSTPS